MESLSDISHLRISPAVICSDVHDELIILHTGTGQYHSLKGLAAEIWRHLQNGRTVTEIAPLILAHYEVEPACLEADLASFWHDLTQKNLLERGVSP